MYAVLWSITMGDIHCHSVFLYSHYGSEFLTISQGKKENAQPLCQLTTLQTGADHAWQNASDQTRRPAKKADEQKARLTARVSHHNK